MTESREQAVPHRRRIGLALGGGGARGWAHLGVLRRLQELRLPIACVAGTSMGAIVGAAFAAGRMDVLEDLARHLDWKRAAQLFLEVGLPRSGLLTGSHIERFLKDMLAVEKIADLGLPFAAVAADIESREEVVLRHGNVVAAIRASIALPGIFTPAHYDGHHLIDGGMINPLPVNVARAMGADIVIAVDVNLRPGCGVELPAVAAAAGGSHGQTRAAAMLERVLTRMPKLKQPVETAMQRWVANRSSPSIFDVLTLSSRMIESVITRDRLREDKPDILIQPAVGDIATLDFQRAAPVIAAGTAAVQEHLEELQALANAR
ncbi:MAG: patatin-like phospholipase family protein [Kiritimatiellae bacterium]|nr:patatin-like phospholipase family protein [Kiritimatiellia bacterium]